MTPEALPMAPTKPVVCEHVRTGGFPMHPRGHCPQCEAPMRIALVASWPFCGWVCRSAFYMQHGLRLPVDPITPGERT